MTDTLTSKTGVKRYTMRAATGQAGATIIESIEHPYGPWVPYGAYELAQRQFDELTAHCNALRDEKADIVRQLDEARPVHETPADDIPMQKPCVEWPDVAAAIHALYDEPREGHRGCGEIALAAAKEIERLRPAVETPAPLMSWRLTDEHINSLQVASVDRLIKRAKAAHYVNVRVRINGDWEEHEADWIKHMKREGSPAEEAVHGIGAPVGELTDEMREVMRHNSASVDQMEQREPSLHQQCLNAQVADAVQRFGPPLTEKPSAEETPPEFAPDSECKEADGCPTEGAVLKRFWRAHHQDIARFRYLTEDIADRVDRQRRNELLACMVVMSYSAACMDIDIAMSERAALNGKGDV